MTELALTLLRDQRTLVKTIKNGDWLGLLWQINERKPFRSSLSLPPAGGGDMLLFGRANSGCAGLVLDIDVLNEKDGTTFCWPSGYFAKTEHNMLVHHDGSVSLVGGRAERLVSLTQLRQANTAHQRARAAAAAGEAAAADEVPHLSYNEVSTLLRGHAGVVAIFVRSHDPDHLRFVRQATIEGRRTPLLEPSLPDASRCLSPLWLTAVHSLSLSLSG